jgi:demethylmenaquinone methyltransferase/2-methoxy-6-polyprenyl-1,4-benzoquinol methylase
MSHSSKPATPNKNPRRIKAFFNEIAPKYDLANTLMSLGQVHLWRRYINRQILQIARAKGAVPPGSSGTANTADTSNSKNGAIPQSGASSGGAKTAAGRSGAAPASTNTATAPTSQPAPKLLDIATGTGTSLKKLVNQGIDLTGLDLSENMLEIARTKYPGVQFVEGSVLKMPFPDNSFDIVTCSFSFRNFGETDVAIGEIFRVLKPGGCFILADFSTPTNRAFKVLYNFYMRRILPLIGKLASGSKAPFDYFTASVLTWYNQGELAEKITKAGFKGVSFHNMSGGAVAVHTASK